MSNQWDKEYDLLVADREQATYGISTYVRRQWKAHRDSARKRGIDFRFTLFQWHCWWSAELAKLGPNARRGRRRDEYVMSRFGDRGAYEPSNVQAVRPLDNARDVPEDVRVMITERCTTTRNANGHPRGAHLRIRGDGHPKAKAVMTPIGRFGSIALAAEAHGITRAGGFYRVKSMKWSFV